MELAEFSCKPCNSGLAYEFLPKKKAALDLFKIARRLKDKNIEIEMETPVFLGIKIAGKNVSLFKSGKMMVKETKQENEARTAAEKLLKELR